MPEIESTSSVSGTRYTFLSATMARRDKAGTGMAALKNILRMYRVCR